jgi:transcriptional regulator with XRE-family HTH domain
MQIPFFGPQLENKYTRFMRERIKQAREERGYTQEFLGKLISRSRVAISDVERGRTEITAFDLLNFAYALRKPIAYFYSDTEAWAGPKADDLEADEKELVLLYREISGNAMRKLAIKQVRQFAEASREADEEEANRRADEALLAAQAAASHPDPTSRT